MELVVVALAIALSGLVVGWLARFAVPGPDPLSIWKTILLGIGGSLLGGLLGGVLLSAMGQEPGEPSGDMWMNFVFSILGAVILLVLYRRFVQGRPITGPDAQRPPTRGV